MSDFLTLRRASKRFSCMEGGLRVAVLGDVATQLFTVAIKGALAERRFTGQCFEAEYAQVVRQLCTEDSEVRRFAPDYAIVWESVEHWWRSGENAEDRLRRVRTYAEQCPFKILYANMAPFEDGVWGSYAGTPKAFAVQRRAFNAGLDALAATLPNLLVVDLESVMAALGTASGADRQLFISSDMPLSLEAQARFAERCADVISAQRGSVRKCVIVDLDNTLWGGVLGEVGLNGIDIGDHGLGRAYTDLQHWLLRLRRRGILLTVCSKNDESLAKEPFEQHPEMVLHLDDFASFIANWETKADNVAHIQKVLNIGFDSFVFLDDNPAERAIVRQAHPEVCVPELPEDPAEWLAFLARENLFETAAYSEADAGRTEQYRQEAKRVAWQATFKDEAGFLRDLNMKATVSLLRDANLPRAAQLTQRSNQFNLRTQRYSEDDLRALAADPATLGLTFTLSDRFGEYGLVCVLIGKQSGDTLFIDTWLMSCRVLKRGLEQFALNRLVVEAKARGIAVLEGEYLPSRKNGMVAQLYPSLGFTSTPQQNHYRLNLSSFTPKETFIHG